MANSSRTGLQLDDEIIGKQVDAAREAGRRGDDRAGTVGDREDLGVAYDEGAAEVEQEQKAAQSANRKATASNAWKSSTGAITQAGGSWKPVAPHRARTPGSLLTGLALYIIAITYIRYGPIGWKGWLAAKFINQPMTASELAGTKSTASPPKTVKV
jgi:hypothetical protein